MTVYPIELHHLAGAIGVILPGIAVIVIALTGGFRKRPATKGGKR